VILFEKANVKRSGAISMGMDGLNNAVIPGHATPEQYVKEITIANDGIVNQKTLMAYAARSYEMIKTLEGLQRTRLRLRDRSVWGLYGQRPRRALHRVRLLERADDAGVLSGA
jgi:succinate dehydrogenase/fumarate reductase flavoprotein subunit